MIDASAAAVSERVRPPWLAPLARGLGDVAKSYLTGPDGKSYAPGRLFAFATFFIAQGLVVRGRPIRRKFCDC